MKAIKIFVEEGQKKTFCGALEWPGWCRFGKKPGDAMEKLIAYAPRYQELLQRIKIPFEIPKAKTAFEVIEWVTGDATTSFGAPAVILEKDRLLLPKDEYYRSLLILNESWRFFDEVVENVNGRSLRKGPRGGGRALDGILEHTIEADRSYLARIASRYKRDKNLPKKDEIDRIREQILTELEQAFRHGLPEKGPRGGKIWPLRFFFKRTIWHILDHAWEIEDRLIVE